MSNVGNDFFNDILNDGGAGVNPAVVPGTVVGAPTVVGGAAGKATVQNAAPVSMSDIENMFAPDENERRKRNTETHDWTLTLVDRFENDGSDKDRKLSTVGYVFRDPDKGELILTKKDAVKYVVEDCYLGVIGTGENALAIEKRVLHAKTYQKRGGEVVTRGESISFYLRPAVKGVAIHRDGRVEGIKEPAYDASGNLRMRKKSKNSDDMVQIYKVKPKYEPSFGRTSFREKGSSAIPQSDPAKTFFEAMQSGMFNLKVNG